MKLFCSYYNKSSEKSIFIDGFEIKNLDWTRSTTIEDLFYTLVIKYGLHTLVIPSAPKEEMSITN